MSWNVILPFLRPIEFLIQDAGISDILVNGSTGVFIETNGRLHEVPGVTIPEKSLQVAVRNIARILDDEIGEEKPLLDSRLPDGSRVAAVFPPCSVTGTISEHSEVRQQALHRRGIGPHRKPRAPSTGRPSPGD
jgi:pilus assembly protein CpaF